MEIDKKSFGLKVNEYRTRLGLSQEQLGEAVDLTPSYISLLENGRRTISLKKLVLLANVLKCGTDELLENSLLIKSESVCQEGTRIAGILDGASEEKREFVYKHIELLIRDFDVMKEIVAKDTKKEN